MHMIIKAIVPGENKEEALANAEAVFEDLVEQGCFDYYSLLTEEHSRWYNSGIPAVAEIDSPEGKELIEAAMKHTKDEFQEHLNKIKDILARTTDEELAEGKSETAMWLRYYCYCIGQYAGPYVWLYNRYGEGIRDQAELKWALEKETEDEKLWVVPVDVHY